MKKSILFFLVIFIIVFSSCGRNNLELPGVYTSDDMILRLKDSTFNFGEDASSLISLLGKPQEVSQILSCLYDGYDKVYKFDNVDVVTFPKDGKDILNEVLFYDGAYTFKGGVKVGSTKDEVIKNYGSRFVMENDAMVYNLEGHENDNKSPHLAFILKDDVVTTIDFYSGCYF